ncbi:MAG: hypothetical protein Q8N62_05360 [Candidatus Omnitrophota bacterium]|nr:hypothetical protein [Candidatus Omnitrophota bacterium]
MKDIVKSLRNSVFTTFFYILLDYYKKQRSWFDYLIIFLILSTTLLLVSLTWNVIKQWYLDWRRKHFPRVGILNGSIKSRTVEHPCRRQWSEMTPSMWFEQLKRDFKKPLLSELILIPTSEIDNSWSIVINPFGENYPEENPRLLKTFKEICEYINKGGIFVVTGSAFFYNQNTFATPQSERVITHVIEGVQYLEYSVLTQEFGVKYTGNIHDIQNKKVLFEEPVEINVTQTSDMVKMWGDLLQGINHLKRFRAATSETIDYLPVIIQEGEDQWNKGKKIFPIALIRYGKGALIHAGLHIHSYSCDEFLVLKRLILKLAKNKFTF